MRGKVIDVAGFEAKFRENIDPWDYKDSPFEAHKRSVLLHACGSRYFGRGLELACAIGETTHALAPRCRRLLAVDASPTALAEAIRRNVTCRRVTFRLSRLPEQTPRGPFDLIVASEILYYLNPNDLDVLVRILARALAPGGRIVILHHLRNFHDAAVQPSMAQACAFRWIHRRMGLVFLHRTGGFEAAAFEKGFRNG